MFRAATKALHWDLSCASLVKDPQVCLMSFISPSTVLLHVVLGLPLLLFPSGVQCSAVLTIASCSLQSTCPIHLHLLLLMVVSMFSSLHLLYKSSFVIFHDRNICRILRRHVVWKEQSLPRSVRVSVILQHSDPYNNVDITQLWYNFNLVPVVYCADLQTLSILLNTFLALPCC